MTEYRLYRKVGGMLFTSYRPGADFLWFDTTAYDVADAVDGDLDAALAGDFPRALDAIYARHNRDDRPDGQRAPSLSVGDVIALDWGTERTRFYSVASFGFDEVDGPMLGAVVNNGVSSLDGVPEDTPWQDIGIPYEPTLSQRLAAIR